MKYLIKDNEIIQSGIPSTFTRENGEAFWGGYQNRTDIHYKDGWRDEVVPEYDPLTQQLGDQYFDAENDVVTYEVIPRVINIEAEKERLLNELSGVSKELAVLIMQAKLNNDPEPPELTELIAGIIGQYTQAKVDISELTEADILLFKIHSPELQGAIDMLNMFL